MSSYIGSSSAHTTEQFNILNSAGEDQQRTISLPPYPSPQNPLTTLFRVNKKQIKFVSSPPRNTLQFETACGRAGMKTAREALNFTDIYTMLAKCCPVAQSQTLSLSEVPTDTILHEASMSLSPRKVYQALRVTSSLSEMPYEKLVRWLIRGVF